MGDRPVKAFWAWIAKSERHDFATNKSDDSESTANRFLVPENIGIHMSQPYEKFKIQIQIQTQTQTQTKQKTKKLIAGLALSRRVQTHGEILTHIPPLR